MAESFPITRVKSLRHIWTKNPQDRRNACSDLRPIYGLDTETSKGTPFLLADSDGCFFDKITPESVIKFLFSKKYQTSWNFFYNITYDAEVILKLLGHILNLYKITGNLVFQFQGYVLEYIPSKKLTIRKGHHSVSFFDIAQFYHQSLVDAYQNNISKLPQDYLQMKSQRKEFSLRYYNRNKKLVQKYCINDCIYTKQLAEHWIKLFHNAFSFYPSRWISSGYLAEKVLINNGIHIPRFDEIPFVVQSFAYNSYFGGRFEILKRGFIGTAHLYDINAAYPFALSKIPDITKGEWLHCDTIQNDVKLGFFKILVDVPECKYVPPFPFRTDNNILIFPSGKFITYCTLDELLTCKNMSYEILDSYQFIPKTEDYPFRDFIEKMYKKRLELKQKNDPLQLPIKIILNSIYGKTGEVVKNRIGHMFNPVIFATITGITRAQLYQFVCENGLEKDIVSFATDSICTTKELKIDSDELGQFSHDNSANDVFFLQNGLYRFGGKWKQRGLGRLGSKQIEHLETIQKDEKLIYKFRVLRSARLRSCILQDSIEDIGKIKEFEREVNLNADRKRLWFGQIGSINDKIMNDSIPLSLNQFKSELI